MKGNNSYLDLGTIFDDIFEAARRFTDDISNFRFDDKSKETPFNSAKTDENVDYYPNYSYPPLNVFMTKDRSLNFEFAVAGFSEKDIQLSFQGDYMTFCAKIPMDAVPEDGIRYFKRRLKLKDIEKQKYFVPADKFEQNLVKAVFKNGILKVIIPPRQTSETVEGVKIEIVKEGT